MDAFLSTLIFTALAEMGDRTQILCAALALRFRHDGMILAAVALATLLNSAVSALAGATVGGWISQDPLTLFYALALLFAGIGMLVWRRPVDLLEHWQTGAFTTAFLGILILQFGDKGQFLIAATAARSQAAGFALAGGWLGTMIALLPAVLLRERLAQLVPLKAIRMAGGAVFLVLGAVHGLMAWRLI
ncbi:MAG: TMEM165/GDT1 family protein [Pseudomonadota bacterium]